MEQALVDTSFLFALVTNQDKDHARVLAALETLSAVPIIAAPVMVELFYLISVRINYHRAVEVFDSLDSSYQIEPLSSGDRQRMREIMRKYAKSEFDYTDTANMALAERLGITIICSLDKDYRFRYYQPEHTEYFTILP
jgi:uncharacterized protein